MTGLEALKKLDFYSDSYSANSEYLSIIAKELKALEIINNKNVDVNMLKYHLKCHNKKALEIYNSYRGSKHHLTQEEFTTLKEVLK